MVFYIDQQLIAVHSQITKHALSSHGVHVQAAHIFLLTFKELFNLLLIATASFEFHVIS